MTRYCQGCINIEIFKENADLCKHLKLDHHESSAGKMEVVDLERIFSRSIETRRLGYTDYYGDGDSKHFVSVQNIDAPKVVSKKECIGHVQKRVGTRLRKLKKTEKDLTKLGLIDRLQNYYGMAIRSNDGDLDTMKKAIFAVLFHVCSSEKNNDHVDCPPGADNWCIYQLDLVNNTKLHKSGKGLPQEAIKHLIPIFSDLSDDNLPRKCLHGKTLRRIVL